VMKPFRSILISLCVPLLLGAAGAIEPVAAREAAFASPGSAGAGLAAGSEAIVVEPKGDVNVGDSVVNVARRSTVFFANKLNSAVEVVSVTTNDDGNVKSSIISDDCSREHSIPAGGRCSIIVETTPVNSGGWTSEVLLTHNGQGRIARAKLVGKASGQFSSEKKETGFALSTKEVKPIEFGNVEANEEKVVRSALMVNDSPENITLISIDVIAADNGLERLDQGCVVDMELKPGESCPVTLVWKPVTKGLISTDLIIRHSGRLGFAVIPIRGSATGSGGEAVEAKGGKASGAKGPSTADELTKAAADKIPPLTSDLLPLSSKDPGAGRMPAATYGGEFHLIGTVGNRAVLLKPDGTTTVMGIGEDISYGDNKTAKITNVMPKEVEIFYEGKKKRLTLAAAAELTSRAAAAATRSDASRPDKQDRKITAETPPVNNVGK
jgi:hypothetical protein